MLLVVIHCTVVIGEVFYGCTITYCYYLFNMKMIECRIFDYATFADTNQYMLSINSELIKLKTFLIFLVSYNFVMSLGLF